jgi:transposase
MQRRTFTPQQKATVALIAMKGVKSLSQIASTFQVNPTQIKHWQKQAEEGLAALFTDKRKKENKEQEQLISELYKLVGQRDIEIDWLKKKLHIDS